MATDRRPARAAELRAVADLLSDGVALCRDGRIEWASARLVDLAGGRELAGAVFQELLSGSEPPALQRVVSTALRRGEELRQVEVRGIALRGGKTAWIVRDVSHVRRLEAELQRGHRELAERARELAGARERGRRESAEREELLTIVAHELRTPATVIGGYHRLLLAGKAGPLNAEQQRFVEESLKSCQRLSAFIGNLLEASRQAQGNASLEVREAPLQPTLENVASFLKPLLDDRELCIELDLDARAGVARFDPVRIERVLSNLISNAVRYAPAGSAIRIETRTAEHPGGRFVEIAVADRGPGVAAEDRERIFLPYVRVGASPGGGGLGLGLALCRRLVEAHGGEIRMEPRSGGGSRFVFTLPAPQRDGP